MNYVFSINNQVFILSAIITLASLIFAVGYWLCDENQMKVDLVLF